MKKKEIKERNKIFFAKMYKFLKPFKQEGDRFFYEFKVETKGGILNIKLEKDDDGTAIYTVYTCFEDLEKVKKNFSKEFLNGINTFSGKWNFHATIESVEPDIFAECVINFIKSVMVNCIN